MKKYSVRMWILVEAESEEAAGDRAASLCDRVARILEIEDGEEYFECAACHMSSYPQSTLQPAFCSECVNAMLHGRKDRLS